MTIPLWVLPVVKAAAVGIAIYSAYQLVDNNWATDAGIKRGVERQAVETAKVQAAYDGFVAEQKALGKAAEAEKTRVMAQHKLEKDTADENLRRARGELAVVRDGLRLAREERARGGYLPAPSPTARDPARAALKRAEFESTMAYLDERGEGIVAQGDDQRIGLDSVKVWAQGRPTQ